MKPANSITV